MIHVVKLAQAYFDDVLAGVKTAEVRYNDRDYKVGDFLILDEWSGSEYTGREVTKIIASLYPLDAIGLKGYVLLMLK